MRFYSRHKIRRQEFLRLLFVPSTSSFLSSTSSFLFLSISKRKLGTNSMISNEKKWFVRVSSFNAIEFIPFHLLLHGSSSGRWCAKTRPSQNQIIFAILIDLNDIQGAISRRDTANRIQGILIVDEIRHVAASQIFCCAAFD